MFNLSAGEDRMLMFKAGSDAGMALVDVDGKRLEFNLWNENVVDFIKELL